MKLLIWLHRYLGVAVGLLMVLWCLSGFVMMYQPYPSVTPEERVQGLPPFGPDERRDPSASPLAEDAALSTFTVEILDGAPVLRLPRGLIDIATGEPAGDISAETARDVAQRFADAHGYDGAVSVRGPVEFDQWTLPVRRAAPFWQARVDGPSDALIYVSAATGEVVQAATGRERFWTWLGAIPHWLYPRFLREHAGTWSQIVIWTSVLGAFLTLFGLYIGIARFRRRPNGRWSPYRKVWLWHHYTGLGFGLLTLTWVFSGLLTMGPFWPMQSRPFLEASAVNGEMRWADARMLIDSALARPDSGELVQIEAAPMLGGAFAFAHYADGRTLRLDIAGAEAPLSESGLRHALDEAGGALEGAALELRTGEDAWYYSHHSEIELPVWRVRTAEESPRLLYVSPTTGQVLRAVDGGARLRRWFETGLHSLDFPGLRARPGWDIVVIFLLGGVTMLCGIGVWLSWDRVRKDWRMLTRRRGAPPAD